MAPSREEIVTFRADDPPPGQSPWVDGRGPEPDPQVVAPDPAWPAHFADLRQRIAEVLGPVALQITHVGSTSVPGLPAKPVIDIDLTVADSDDEAAYVPAVEGLGFVLVVREPWWEGHRCLRLSAPRSNLHVFGPDAAEPVRHRIFRDWLIADPDDRARYAAAKREAAERTRAAGGHTMDYNRAKQAVIREIYARAFRAAGLTR